MSGGLLRLVRRRGTRPEPVELTRMEAAQFLAAYGYVGNSPSKTWPLRPCDLLTAPPEQVTVVYRRAIRRLASSNPDLLGLARRTGALLGVQMSEAP